MNLTQIKERASNEEFKLHDYIKEIQKKIRSYPNGYDFLLPYSLIPKIVAYCDANQIPIYHTAENTCSIAVSYVALLAYEEAR